MSLAYQKMKMRATHTVVEYMRNFCDGVNVVLGSVMLPLQRVGRRLSAESPWVVLLGACTLSMVVPLLAYPYVKPIIAKDTRALHEEERVRMCLQKGIDPYPYLRHKDFVYGNNTATFSRESEHPKDSAWEWALMEDYEKRREELRAEVDGALDDSVERLLRMRENKKRAYQSTKRSYVTEPTNLVFKGRGDVNQLNS